MRCIFRIFLAIFVPFHHEKLKFRRIKIKELFFNKSPTYGFAIFGAIENVPFHHRKMKFRKKKVFGTTDPCEIFGDYFCDFIAFTKLVLVEKQKMCVLLENVSKI